MSKKTGTAGKRTSKASGVKDDVIRKKLEDGVPLTDAEILHQQEWRSRMEAEFQQATPTSPTVEGLRFKFDKVPETKPKPLTEPFSGCAKPPDGVHSLSDVDSDALRLKIEAGEALTEQEKLQHKKLMREQENQFRRPPPHRAPTKPGVPPIEQEVPAVRSSDSDTNVEDTYTPHRDPAQAFAGNDFGINSNQSATDKDKPAEKSCDCPWKF